PTGAGDAPSRARGPDRVRGCRRRADRRRPLRVGDAGAWRQAGGDDAQGGQQAEYLAAVKWFRAVRRRLWTAAGPPGPRHLAALARRSRQVLFIAGVVGAAIGLVVAGFEV